MTSAYSMYDIRYFKEIIFVENLVKFRYFLYLSLATEVQRYFDITFTSALRKWFKLIFTDNYKTEHS